MRSGCGSQTSDCGGDRGPTSCGSEINYIAKFGVFHYLKSTISILTSEYTSIFIIHDLLPSDPLLPDRLLPFLPEPQAESGHQKFQPFRDLRQPQCGVVTAGDGRDPIHDVPDMGFPLYKNGPQ